MNSNIGRKCVEAVIEDMGDPAGDTITAANIEVRPSLGTVHADDADIDIESIVAIVIDVIRGEL
ncbi:hypothetical protein G1C98_1049 [Bifidobacterium sp. DSM 109960]|uniref:Uncharacterized protein n=1 Tax=Bifidobacterium erythrocebi TaxID=2675325 RepID=A0A7Y0EUN7_9BIFI|nr:MULTISPECIES: hypothetical protein [Bifidobacterium]MBW3095368.1 hypothetical protein [Bifidobacterium pongonis]NMM96313.1 hypothetical protein [Bifidobacterium sp. DSM 109960]